MNGVCTVLARNGSERLALLDYRKKAAVGIGADDVELNISVNDLGLGLFTVIVGDKSVYRHAHGLRIGKGSILICIVLAVELTAHGK